MSEAFIIDAVRTPRGIGKPGKGALAGMHPQHLAAAVLKALQIETDVMAAPLSLPRLRRGENRLVYTDLTPAPHEVTITH